MATANLFCRSGLSDGAFTANDPAVRAYALQKTMRAMDLGAELGAKIYVFWGGREGVETDACRRPDEARQALSRGDQLSLRVHDRAEVRLQIRSRSQAQRAARRHLPADHRHTSSPSSPRSIIPRWSASIPKSRTTHGRIEFPARRRAGLEAGKLFHIDLNDQESAATIRISVSARPIPRARSFSSSCSKNRLLWPAPLRRPRLPHRRLRRRQGFRPRLHAHLPDPQGKSGALRKADAKFSRC